MTTAAERKEAYEEVLTEFPTDPKCPHDAKPKRYALVCLQEEEGKGSWVSTHGSLKEASHYVDEDESDFMAEACVDLDTGVEYEPIFFCTFVEAEAGGEEEEEEQEAADAPQQ